MSVNPHAGIGSLSKLEFGCPHFYGCCRRGKRFGVVYAITVYGKCRPCLNGLLASPCKPDFRVIPSCTTTLSSVGTLGGRVRNRVRISLRAANFHPSTVVARHASAVLFQPRSVCRDATFPFNASGTRILKVVEIVSPSRVSNVVIEPVYERLSLVLRSNDEAGCSAETDNGMKYGAGRALRRWERYERSSWSLETGAVSKALGDRSCLEE